MAWKSVSSKVHVLDATSNVWDFRRWEGDHGTPFSQLWGEQFASPCVTSIIFTMQRGNGPTRAVKQNNLFLVISWLPHVFHCSNGQPTEQHFVEYIFIPFMFVLWVTLGPDREMRLLRVALQGVGCWQPEADRSFRVLLSCGAPACSSEQQALQPVAEYVSAVRETISLLSSFCWFQKSRSTLGFNGLSAQFLLFSFFFVGVVLVSLLHSVSACPLQRQHVQYFLDSVSWWLALVASNLFLLQIARNGNLCTCVCARNQEAGLLEVELWLDLKLSLGFWIQILQLPPPPTRFQR